MSDEPGMFELEHLAKAVGPEPGTTDVDTSARPEDGEQDVDQTPDFEVAESDDNEEDDDPEVHEVA